MSTWQLLRNSSKEKLLVSSCQPPTARRPRPTLVQAQALATEVAVVVVVVVLVGVVTSDSWNSLAKRQIAFQCTTRALMSVVRSLHTSASLVTHKHSSAGIYMPSCTDQTKALQCRPHSFNASVANPVPMRVATARSSMLVTSSLRKNGLLRKSLSRRNASRWKRSGQMVWIVRRSED